MKKKTRIFAALCAVFLCLILPGFYNGLKIVRYDLKTDRLVRTVRIALITDLHSCAYGENQQELLDAIDSESPDLVLLGGDIFDNNLPIDKAAVFMQGICRKYPCFYVTGNHEYWSGMTGFAEKMAVLENCGVVRLSGETAPVEIHGDRIEICGVDDPCAWVENEGFVEHADGSFREQVSRVAEHAEKETYTILLTHRPELFDFYCQYGFDLILAGHAHGGQWRIPSIINGLWAPNQGLFPEYAGGMYEQNGTAMIVSRGLARESTKIPRFYNRPELVMIILNP